MSLSATYVSSTSFTVAGDYSALITENRRVKADCGVDGIKYVTVASSSYASPNTTVTVNESELTSNLSVIDWGVTSSGATGSLPLHDHSDNDEGGTIPFTQNVLSYSAAHTLTAAQCRGHVVYVTAAAVITLPAVAEGLSVVVVTIGDVAVSVDPNASDKIWLDGTALDDGDKITNDSSAGDIAVLTYYSADGWHASTNGWTDGGA